MEKCPSCGQPSGGAPECKGCGLIFAKWKPPEVRAQAAPEAKSSGISPVFLVLILAVAGGGWWVHKRYAQLAGDLTESAKPLPFAWPPEVGQPYPDLQLVDDKGQAVSLASYKGKVLVIETAGMSCPACNAFAGANKMGGFSGAQPQGDLSEIEGYVKEYAGGDYLTSPNVVFVQLMLYGPTMQAPTVAELGAWRDHFKLRERFPNMVLVTGGEKLNIPASYRLVPGFQVVDKDFVLRYDATGHRPRHNLYTELLPQFGALARN